MEFLNEIGRNAKEAARIAAKMNSSEKNHILKICSKAVLENTAYILSENKKDIEEAEKNNMKPSLIDRLMLNEKRLDDIASAMEDIAKLDDPIGEVLSMKKLENGLTIGQKRVPMGVIGIIYESRPNVTADSFSLCLKAGSAVILKGGKDAINSNKAITDTFRDALSKNNYPVNLIQLIEDNKRETTVEFMKMSDYLNVLIPRGSKGLIEAVVKNSTVPVIETGTGNCHIFVDETADLERAVEIIINAKVQRPGVCNACEKVLVHEKISEIFLPKLTKALKEENVQIRGDEILCRICPDALHATEEDWHEEYLDLIIGIKTVKDVDEAISHIYKYSSGHSEAILTNDYKNSQKFLEEVDSAAVYVNASTRFTDGFEFGLGAEIGISTQKLHARGPMGLKELTSTKYIIYGNGQIRK